MGSDGGDGVVLDGVTASYGVAPVLSGITLDIVAGELVALLGPSGCGKTTLLRCIAGLEAPTRGSISIGGEVVSRGRGTPPERRRVGMVFQDGALFPHLSVIDNVRYGMARSERRGGRARELLDLVGLADKGERPPGTLSGGEQQRVAVARALARRPAVLLLDEPFSSLDTALRVQLRGEVHRLLKEVGVTTVLVTHDQHEALMFGDRVAVMRSGRLEQVDTPAGLYRRPASAWVAGFVGEANLLAGAAREGAAGVGGTASEGSAGNGAATDGSGGNGAAGAGSGTAGAGADRSVCTAIGAITTVRRHQGSVVVLCRPEELVMRAGGDARLLGVAYFGQESRYEVRLASGESVVVRASGVPAHDPGDQVTVRYTGGEAAAWPSSLP